MNIVDWLVLLLVALAAYRGFRRGLLGQVFELGGGFLGLLVGVAVGPRIASAFTDESGAKAAMISLVAVFVLLSLGQTAGFLLGHRFSSVAKRAQLGQVDAGLGIMFGIGMTLVSFWLIGSLLVQGPSKDVARAFRNSELLSVMNDSLPQPPDLLSYLQKYLNTSGFPQVFITPPEESGPVKLPTEAEARKASRKALESMVQIVVPACGKTQFGSGWIAADHTIVTNAHVVAGGDEVTLRYDPEADGDPEDFSGTVVIFDPDIDLAVIHSDDLDGPSLDLETATLERGTKGATLGYPGGKPLQAHRAAITNQFPAVGRDIYHEDEVTRDIYEVQSPVERGDSGGPFVLTSGEVAGVIFAASVTSDNTGYALTGAEVEDEIIAGARRTSAVSTQGCTH